MEDLERELIRRYSRSDNRLKRLYLEHLSFERKLRKLSKRNFLTMEEETSEKQLKKQKLFGVDRMMMILLEYRNGKVRTAEAVL